MIHERETCHYSHPSLQLPQVTTWLHFPWLAQECRFTFQKMLISFSLNGSKCNTKVASQLIKGLQSLSPPSPPQCSIRDESQNTAPHNCLFWKHTATIHYQSTGHALQAQRTHQHTLQAEELANMMTPFLTHFNTDGISYREREKNKPNKSILILHVFLPSALYTRKGKYFK